ANPEPAEVPPSASRPEDEASLVASLRAFLKHETDRLRAWQATGMGGHEVAAGRSAVIDHVVTRACREAAARATPAARRHLLQCTVVALGGYGRQELSPFSDVDLLFLHGGATSPTLAAFVERTLITLWDAGLMVGHSFRSVRDCVTAAREDLHSHTALIQARLVTGNEALFDGLLRRLETSLRHSRAAQQAFAAQMRAQWAQRLAHHGGAVCALEPQVKEGPGGLRDLHSVLWVAGALGGVRTIGGLDAPGLLDAADYVAARQAYDFLLRVRNEAHFTTGRKTDLLTLDLQGELASRLGYRDRGRALGSELMMRDYYRRAFRLHEICKEIVEAKLETKPRLRLFGSLRLPARRRRALEEKDGVLQPRKGWAPRSGGGLLDAVERCQSTGVPPSRALKRALRAHAALAGGRFRRSHDAGAKLLKLAGRRGRVAGAFRLMHETGVLGRLVPEWSRVTFLVQHDFFHKYSVDEHTLRAIDALDELARGREPQAAPLARLLDEIQDARPLYLGMWLHDIGKGRGGGHVPKGVELARRILARLGIEGEVADDAVFLVGAHLEMSQTSQQRDLSEDAPVEAFAARVGSVLRLNLLMLLTYADHQGVGPGIWNAWKASLLWDLYERTRHVLDASRGGARADRASAARGHAVAELNRYFSPDEVERHFALLPERYLRATEPAHLASHFRLVRSRGPRPAAFEWADRGDGHGTDLTVTADDRPGLLSLLAGTLTVHGLDILAADVFARNDGVVLDTLRVAERPGHRSLRPERRVRLEAALLEAVTGQLDVSAAFVRWRAQDRKTRRAGGRAARQPRVRFDQEASSVATVVEVRAPDQPGLVYTLARTLAEQGIDITSARIATAKALALDVFYVRDAEGRKLDPDTTARVEGALLQALGARAEDRPEA
ncbi:MAG TPA: [protein-PII] uridylyltransferase, partial [Vicinamibacteria bacterium]|nr:[protein-PII] uridylyltransferase [Vicinamibacteria bacterium]